MTENFAAAADEVWRLQNDDDPECRWFRTAVRGKPDAVNGSMQGTYVLTPRGRLLGRLNSNNPTQVLAMMKRSLAAWSELSDDERSGPQNGQLKPVHRWEDSRPKSGLVLERFARDVQGDPSAPPTRPVNRDAVWFTQSEAKGWLPEAKVGATKDVASHIVNRLSRFAFVDNVRGQTLPFAQAEVRDTKMRSDVLAIRGSLVDIRITGHTMVKAKGPWVGGDNYWTPNREWPRQMTTKVFGHATLDQATGQFTEFELVALGDWVGRTALNGRHREVGGSMHKIGFLLRLAPPAYRVAPTFINMYGTKWVTPPPGKRN